MKKEIKKVGKNKERKEEDSFNTETSIMLPEMLNADSDSEFASSSSDTHDSLECIRNQSYNDIKNLTKKPHEKYFVQSNIGLGGMKRILKVWDRDTVRDIALATLRDKESSQSMLSRFIHEARITANLEHPNIIPVHDIGVDDDGLPYFTMKLVRGETLATIIKKLNAGDKEYEKRFDLTNLLLIFRKICNAIAFAHSKGIIHLDLNPENIQIGNFGEVLVLDWGLAKVISKKDKVAEKQEEGSNSNTGRQFISPDLTMDGEIKGTVGYMAPEQAAGRNTEKNELTDIYALGAILYAMLTREPPLTIPENADELEVALIDTIEGNFVPPKKKAPKLFIPAALEAVVMKAMNVSPAKRYQSVSELRRDIDAFIGGFATTAEEAGTIKKTFLFLNRHRVAAFFSTLIIILLLAFGKYAQHEASKRIREWIPVYNNDFTLMNFQNNTIEFKDKFNKKPVKPCLTDWTGIKMRPDEWLWIKNTDIRKNFRITIKFVYTEKPGELDICVAYKDEPFESTAFFPEGYVFIAGDVAGSRVSIYKSNGKKQFRALTSRIYKPTVNKLQTLILENRENILKIYINDKTILQTEDIFSFPGKSLNIIGMRSRVPGLKLQGLRVERLALPEKAAPVIAGDALAEAGYYKDAINKYLTIAENYKHTAIADKALEKAYITALLRIPNNSNLINDIKKKIKLYSSGFRYYQKLLETEALVYWKYEKYKKCLNLISKIFERYPNSQIILQILQLPHKKLPDKIRHTLLLYVTKMKSVDYLDLSNIGLNTLDPLKNMYINYLNCSGNPIPDLSPIVNLPLNTLNIAFCPRIKNIDVVKKIKRLKYLIISSNQKLSEKIKSDSKLTIIVNEQR